MSMIHPHPVLDANAHGKSMIDAVTGHPPVPLDNECSPEKSATPKQKLGEKSAKTIGSKTSSHLRNQVAGEGAVLPRVTSVVPERVLIDWR